MVDGYSTSLTQRGGSGHEISCRNSVYLESHDYINLNSCYRKCDYCNYIEQYSGHVYGSDYSHYNENMHYSHCGCGEKITELHDFIESNGFLVCTECGFSKVIPHEHVFVYTPVKDGRTHVKSCSCGVEEVERCFGTAMVGEIARCNKCGWLLPILPGPGILSDDEESDTLGYVYVDPTLLNYDVLKAS